MKLISLKRLAYDCERGRKEGWDKVDLSIYPETLEQHDNWPCYSVNVDIRQGGLYPSEIAAFMAFIPDDSGFDGWPRVQAQIPLGELKEGLEGFDALFITSITLETMANCKMLQFGAWSAEAFLLRYASMHYPNDMV